MANKIKGITIEIDGNTSKLDKALKSTNTELKSTQNELSRVNKLLKLDPGNTELIAQKQRLLGKSAEEAARKVEITNQALKKADEALSRGNAYEEKFAPLRKEMDALRDSIAKFTKEKEAMENGLSTGEFSTAEYDAVSKKLEELRGAMSELSTQKKALDKEFAGDKINQAGYDSIVQDLVQFTDEAERAEKEAKQFNSTLGQMAQKTAALSEKAGKVSNVFAPVSAGIAAIGAAAFAAVPATEEFRADLSMLEQNSKIAGVGLNSTMEAFRTFNAVSGETDSSIEAVSNLLQAGTTESNLQRAVENLAGAAEMFPDTLKIESLADSLQETVRTGQATGQFAELIDRLGISLDDVNYSLSATSDESQRLNTMLDVLSSAGLAQNHAAWVQENQDLVDSRNAQLDLMDATADLANTLQPVITSVTEALAGMLDWFNQLPSGVQTGIAGLLLFVGGISPVAGAISSVSQMLSGLSGLFAGLGGSVAPAAGAMTEMGAAAGGLGASLGGIGQAVASVFLGPVGIVAGAAAAAIALTVLWDTNEQFRAAMMDFDQWITGVFTTDWTDSFGAAGEVLNAFFATAQNFYESFKQIFGGIIDFIGGAFSGDWERSWQGVISIFEGIWNLLTSVLTAPINGAIGIINSFLQFVANGVNGLISLLNGLSIDVPDWVPGIGGQTWGFDLSPVTPPKIPYLAQGTVARPNHPFTAVIGDNKTEPEIVSPYSTIMQAVKDAISPETARSSAPANLSATVVLDGVVVGRLLVPYIDGYKSLRGANLVLE